MYNGIINIYKEKSFTSHDVVAKLRGILKQKKIGHTGTLDPDATGVLPVCLGSGTKLCDMLTDRDKTYETVLLLGKSTETQDISGNIIAECDDLCELRKTLSDEKMIAAVNSFVGYYEQIPPMYSALKVNGKKLYELAREGIEIERKARKVKINAITITKIEYPRITMTVECSKGTYIRTLCHDIGNVLGTFGCMEALKRTKVGIFKAENAITIDEVRRHMEEGNIEDYIIPTDKMFENYKAVRTNKVFDKILFNGNYINTEILEDGSNIQPISEEMFRVYDSDNVFRAVYIYDERKKILKPYKMFNI